MDLESVIVNFANGGVQPLITLLMAVALIGGTIGTAVFLVRAKKTAQHSADGSGMGRIIAGLLICACLICLRQLMNAGGNTLGYGEVTFGSVSYASSSTFGLGATTVNAILTILRVVGAYMFYKGVKDLKNSQLEGHTELSSSGTIGKAWVKLVCGLLLMFNPEVLDSLQTSLGISW